MIEAISYPWRTQLGRLLNSGQTRSIVLTGEVAGLFYIAPDETNPHGHFVNLSEYLAHEWNNDQTTLIVLKVDGTILFLSNKDEELIARAWANDGLGQAERERKIQRFVRPHSTEEQNQGPTFTSMLKEARGNPAVSVNLLRELCRISRESTKETNPLYKHRLIILVENADIMLPEGQLHQLGAAYQSRIIQMREWFVDPAFGAGRDIVILVSESTSAINRHLSRLPQVLSCEIPSPSIEERRHFIEWFEQTSASGGILKLWGSKDDLALMSAALDLHALRQILQDARFSDRAVEPIDVIKRVERFIQRYLGGDNGADVVEFHVPHHRVSDLVGIDDRREFLEREVIARFKTTGEDVLSGMIVAGPIGSGKTYEFEAVASELGMPVLILKAIRSKWFGETDIILERLRRVLMALSKVMLFIDEADTKFGGLGAETHETERRLTGELQKWMSDPRMKGRVIWLLMTARIHLLSPDIRRKGRGGNLVYGVFDPFDADRDAVIEWMIKKVVQQMPGRQTKLFKSLRVATDGWSMGDFSHMRTELIAKAKGSQLDNVALLARVEDELPGDLAETRRYQILQALLSITRASLIPKRYLGAHKKVTPELRLEWRQEIRLLETMGIH